MNSFPDTFADATSQVTEEVVGPDYAAAVQELATAGCEAHSGLTPELADAIASMALEPGIQEYCPRDCAERFANRSATQNWLNKRRGVFLLLKKSVAGELSLAGYGWVGSGQSDHVPGGETTFALRIGEAGQGQGLATPFARLIIAAAAKLYGARKIWLETSASNGAAVHVYHKIGFHDVDQKDYLRLRPNGEKVPDTRIYMLLPDELLPSA